MRFLGISLLTVSGLVAASAADAPQASYADVVKEMLDFVEKLTARLSAIQDEETAKSARPELAKAAASWQKILEKAGDMKPPTRAEKERLEKEYREKMRAAPKKLFAEIARVKGVPGGPDALKEISATLKKK
jgi:hypothetical protein